MSTVITGAAKSPLATISSATSQIDELQQKRTELVEDYLEVRPRGNTKASKWVGAGAGVTGTVAAIALAAQAVKGRNPLYQGLTMMFTAPAVAGLAGATGFFVSKRLVETVTRPTGADATAQIAQQRANITKDIQTLDQQLHELDGRRSQPLPTPDDSVDMSLGRVAGYGVVGGFGGMMGTGAAIGLVDNFVGKDALKGGLTVLAPVAATAVAASAISYLNNRDEVNGGQGSYKRAMAIGAAAVGASALMPAFSGAVNPLIRAGAGALVGAGIGALVHTPSVSSRD